MSKANAGVELFQFALRPAVWPSREMETAAGGVPGPGEDPRRLRKDGEGLMAQIFITLLAGALGGNAAGKASSTFDIGLLGNTLAGLVGGGVLSQIVIAVSPAVSAAVSGGALDAGTILAHAIGGGAAGALLTAIIGAIKNRPR